MIGGVSNCTRTVDYTFHRSYRWILLAKGLLIIIIRYGYYFIDNKQIKFCTVASFVCYIGEY